MSGGLSLAGYLPTADFHPVVSHEVDTVVETSMFTGVIK